MIAIVGNIFFVEDDRVTGCSKRIAQTSPDGCVSITPGRAYGETKNYEAHSLQKRDAAECWCAAWGGLWVLAGLSVFSIAPSGLNRAGAFTGLTPWAAFFCRFAAGS